MNEWFTGTLCEPTGLFRQSFGPSSLRSIREIASDLLGKLAPGYAVIVWDSNGLPEESIKLPMEECNA